MEGSLLDVKTPDEYIQSYNGALWSVESESPYTMLKQLDSLSVTKSAYMFGRNIHWIILQNAVVDPDGYLREQGILKFR